MSNAIMGIVALDLEFQTGKHQITNIKSQTNSRFKIRNPKQPAYAKTLRWASVPRLDILFRLLFLPGLFLFGI